MSRENLGLQGDTVIKFLEILINRTERCSKSVFRNFSESKAYKNHTNRGNIFIRSYIKNI